MSALATTCAVLKVQLEMSGKNVNIVAKTAQKLELYRCKVISKNILCKTLKVLVIKRKNVTLDIYTPHVYTRTHNAMRENLFLCVLTEKNVWKKGSQFSRQMSENRPILSLY